MQKPVTADSIHKEIVLSFIDALNEEDFHSARSLVADSFTFSGPLGFRSGANSYFQDMERMRLKYSIEKAFADGDEVCVLYDITMAGKSVYACGLYRFIDGKIVSLRVVFDPRPLL
jgi:predicted ester cyclase